MPRDRSQVIIRPGPARHRRAARGRSIDAATNVEKNRAPCARSGGSELCRISTSQGRRNRCDASCFLKPWRRIRRIVDRNEAIVVRMFDVIDPGVGSRDLMNG